MESINKINKMGSIRRRIYSTFESLNKRIKECCVEDIWGWYIPESDHIYILRLKVLKFLVIRFLNERGMMIWNLGGFCWTKPEELIIAFIICQWHIF